jgi:arylsulfatase A-like enzyme
MFQAIPEDPRGLERPVKSLFLSGAGSNNQSQSRHVYLLSQDFVMRTILCCFCVLTSLQAEPARPNILIILADDLGYGDLSSYGATDLKSPNIDALVNAGVRLNNFYANCPVCSPTRASLLTGRYPELVGVPGVVRTHATNNWGYLAPSATTIANQLKAIGYHTAIVGKWHLGLQSPNTPNERGFDHFHGFLGDMMDDYYKHRRHNINYMRLNKEEIDPPGHATDLFSQWASEYITEQSRAEKPFFLYLAYNAPHTPIQPPKEWTEKVKTREKGITDKRAKIVALIEHMDAGIGKVVQSLKDSNVHKNTLIIFTSDNGGQASAGANNGNLRGAKQEMYEGGIKVPMCAVWPGKIKPGIRSNIIGMTMDLYPTLCEITGRGIKRKIDGISLSKILLGQNPTQPERDFFWTRREGGTRYMGKTIWAIRRGDWKLLQNSPMSSFELYNIGTDPLEKVDLSIKNRRQYNELAAALRAHMQRGGSVPWQRP